MGVLMLLINVIILEIVMAAVSNEPAVKSKIHDVKNAKAFGSLLKSIVNVNKERLSTMHKLTLLQELPFSSKSNRKASKFNSESDEDTYDYDNYELPQILGYLIVPSNRLNTNQVPFCKISLKKDSDARNKRNRVNNSLRSCKSEKKQKCKKACRKAMRAACDVFQCEKHLRIRLRKECKLACTEVFEEGYIDNDDKAKKEQKEDEKWHNEIEYTYD